MTFCQCDFDESFTHGFLSSSVDKDQVIYISTKVVSYVRTHQFPTYVSRIHLDLPIILSLISEELQEKVKDLLLCNEISLVNVELHCLPPKSLPIPPHQDSFYHCIEGSVGLKLLIPLCDLNINDGGLVFFNCKSSIGVLPHVPSHVRNFSACVETNYLDSLCLGTTSYNYCIGDLSYHLLNSIHFSYGNRSNTGKYFLVFRYQPEKARESMHMLSRYNQCYAEHLKLISL